MKSGVRRVAAAAAGLLAAGSVAGCGLFHSTPRIDDATRFLPASTTALVFTDRQGTAARLDEDISGRDATDEDITRYTKAFADQGWGGTQLAAYLPVMQDAPFNELDIRWEASARWGTGSSARSAYVWRAGDKTDLSALGRSLTENGYRKDTVDGLARYSVDFAKVADATGLVGGLYPAAMANVLLDSDDHLVVGSGSSAALGDIAAVASGDATSLSKQQGDYAPLLDKADKAEFAAMSSGTGICQAVTPYGSQSTSPGPEYAALGHPVARALVATGDPLSTITYLEFGSDADATADATARETLIRTGTDLRSGQPFSQLGTFDVSHSGDLVEVDSDWATGPRAAVSSELTGGGPAACLP